MPSGTVPAEAEESRIPRPIINLQKEESPMSAIETRCVQGGYTPGNGEPRQIPIIQSTTFKYNTSEDMGKLFDLEASGYF